MAFLLSPKTGGGSVSYVFATSSTDILISINDAEPRAYTYENPGTVAPGDIINVADAEAPHNFTGSYFDEMTEGAQPLKTVSGTMPYTVEEVAGAIAFSAVF